MKSLYGNTFDVFIPRCLGLKDGVNAKILSEISCSIIIEWYAYESKATNDIAKNTFRKFARKGFNSWVKELTGFSEENKLDKLTQSINYLIEEVKELKVTTNKYNNITQTNIKVFLGVNMINEEIKDGDYLEELDNNNLFTAIEWLSSKGIVLNNTTKRKFVLMLGQTYRSVTQKEPTKVMRKDKNGNKTQKVNGFNKLEEPILQVVLTKLINSI